MQYHEKYNYFLLILFDISYIHYLKHWIIDKILPKFYVQKNIKQLVAYELVYLFIVFLKTTSKIQLESEKKVYWIQRSFLNQLQVKI